MDNLKFSRTPVYPNDEFESKIDSKDNPMPSTPPLTSEYSMHVDG
jgi:hypothetical protein